MADLPLKIGAALNVAHLPTYRDWLFEDQRDLEIQDFADPTLPASDWAERVDAVKGLLDGFEGRLGIHGPFYDLPLDARDPEIAPLITRRLDNAVIAAARLGARQMVVHSPFSTWNWYNAGNQRRPGLAKSPTEMIIDRVCENLRDVVARAETEGVVLVIENIEDVDPSWRRDLVAALGSDAVQVSIDTGHAHYAHGATGAPPVDYFVTDAGAMLGHVHLQDADGFADRHWPPGRGTVNWHAVFRALASLSHSPHLVLELADPADIPVAMDYLSREGLAC